MSFFSLFRPVPKSASTAKDRLSVIVSRERTGSRGAPDYLPQLQQELLAVLARYEKIDLEHVSVALDRTDGREILELNILLPNAATGRYASA
ncbi:MAG: cell division topological specificity factor MinE [Bacteroidota bacterium]